MYAPLTKLINPESGNKVSHVEALILGFLNTFFRCLVFMRSLCGESLESKPDAWVRIYLTLSNHRTLESK